MGSGRGLGEEACSLAEIFTPARFRFFGGEYLARIPYSINMIFADIAGMYLPKELRSGILAGRKTRLPEKTETQRRDFLMVASPSSPSPKLIRSKMFCLSLRGRRSRPRQSDEVVARHRRCRGDLQDKNLFWRSPRRFAPRDDASPVAFFLARARGWGMSGH
jgi:hypothetical protein